MNSSTNFSSIKAVSFDATGTLMHMTETVGCVYARIARHHGVIADPERIESAFQQAWKTTPAPFSSDDCDLDERRWWSRLVEQVFRESEAPFESSEHFDEFFDELYGHFTAPEVWRLEKDAIEVVETIASKYRCVILSNFDSRHRTILANLGLYSQFEAFFLSGEQRLSKPDPRLFSRVAEHLDLPPSAILHVGDHPRCDWAGAAQAGFHHFRVGPGQSSLSELLRKFSLAHD